MIQLVSDDGFGVFADIKIEDVQYIGPGEPKKVEVSIVDGTDFDGDGNSDVGFCRVDVKASTETQQFDIPFCPDGLENISTEKFANPGGQIPAISNIEFYYCPPDGGGQQQNGDGVCFEPDQKYCVGFEWRLPVDHANEIQDDSVKFDLGFYTEQCRHNDGSGLFNSVTLTGDSPQGQGVGFANSWDISTTMAHTGTGSWGTIDRSGQGISSYKQGFYFGGEFDDIDALPEYTIGEIEEISYWLKEPTDLEGVDIYLNIYTKPKGDGDDAASWYDSRLQALPSRANQGSPNFTPGQWNEFSTSDSALNTLNWSDTGRGGNFNLPLPTLSDLRSGPIDWSAYGANLSMTHDYSDETVRALSLQTGSESGISLEAYIDDVRVELTNGETLHLDLEP